MAKQPAPHQPPAQQPIRVTVRYFAALQEHKGLESEVLLVPPRQTVQALFATLFPRHKAPVSYAINHTQVPANTLVKPGDTVAFLPPFGGG